MDGRARPARPARRSSSLTLATSLGWPRPALRAMRGIALVASPLGGRHARARAVDVPRGGGGPGVAPGRPRALSRRPRRVSAASCGSCSRSWTRRSRSRTRPAGLELPELDRLRRESLYADAARPPAGTTEVSMPALITGRPVVAVVPVSPNDARAHLRGRQDRAMERAPERVLARARVRVRHRAGRVAPAIPACPRRARSGPRSGDRPPPTNRRAATPFGEAFLQSMGKPRRRRCTSAGCRRSGSRELGDLALRAATDGRFGLVLLHLPLAAAAGHLRSRHGPSHVAELRRRGGGVSRQPRAGRSLRRRASTRPRLARVSATARGSW